MVVAAACSGDRHATGDAFSELAWYVSITTFIIWGFLTISCPVFTVDQCKFFSDTKLRFIPIPYSSVCQCLDRLPVACLIRVANFRSRSSKIKYPLVSLLLLLAGDVQLNPGPAALSFAHLNTNSIASVSLRCDKPALLQDFIIDRGIELLSISETRLHENELSSTINLFTPDNFTFIHNPRPGSKGPDLPGGGVGFLYRSYLKLTQLTIPVFKSFEAMCVDFSVGSKPFRVLTIYRPPSSSVADFVNEFSSLLENLISCKSELVITGDFNFHVDVSGDVDARRFLSILDNFALKQLVTFSTHKYGHTLDLLITRIDSDIVSSLEFDFPCLSDHYALLASLSIPSKLRSQTITKSVRKINKIDISQFRQDILASSIYTEPAQTLNSYTEQFTYTLTQIIDKHAPLHEIKCADRISKPFITDNIRLEKKIRSRLETKYRKSRLSVDLQAFKTQTRLVKKLITSARRNYYRTLISKYKEKPRKLWSTIDTILGRQVIQSLPTFVSLADITKSFLDFFNNKISTLCQKLSAPTIDPCSLPPEQPLILSSFTPANVDEVSRIISSSSDSTCLLDCIPTSLLKSCVDVLSEPITKLVNFSLSEGVFPDTFKSAHLKPLLKKPGLSSEDMANYRPISNLSNISKFLERIIYNRLSNHIHSFNIYSPLQSAYRRFHSTETALLKIQNDLLLAIENKQVTALVLLDLSAAFDTIDHAILIHRLQNWFGISGSALQLMSSYLTGRTQSVIINGHPSQSEPLLTGVPQGSVLGPLLFTIYTTPVAHLIHDRSFSFHLYADDTQIYISFSSHDSQVHLNALSSTLDFVHSWFSSNRLTLNPNKTEYLIIGTWQQRAKLASNSLKFANSVLVPVQSARNLGVIFDNELSFESHISKICQTSFLHIRQIRRVRHLLDYNSAILLANSLVSSRLDYCNSLFFGLPDCMLDRLQRVQNSLARAVVPSVRRYDHITPTLATLHWLPIRKRIHFKIATITFKILNNNQPAYLRDLVKLHKPIRSLRSGNKQLLEVPDIRSANGRRSFSFAAPTVWNALPEDLKSSSILTFRRKLKSYLFPP
jgi:hypothetical protein